MSRTYRKDWKTNKVVNDGKVTRPIYGCGCEYCQKRAGVTVGVHKSIKLKHDEVWAEREIEKALQKDDYYFGNWYEGMMGEEKLTEYWHKQWMLDEKSDILMKEVA